MKLRPNEIYFAAFFALIVTLNVLDLWADHKSGSGIWHLSIEMVLIIASLGGLAFLVSEVWQRQKQLEVLQTELKRAHQTLSANDQKLKAAGRAYTQVIQQQFEEWQLSPSEREVATLLLKGLSFDEVAAVRRTKEKTVRQQASALYRKSGLNGRHALAAWFFEDFLLPADHAANQRNS